MASPTTKRPMRAPLALKRSIGRGHNTEGGGGQISTGPLFWRQAVAGEQSNSQWKKVPKMKKPGRKSSAEIASIGPEGIGISRRPEPPSELSDEMREVWQAIVNALPADWFNRGALPVLAQYCRHTVAARRCAQLIEQMEGEDPFDVSAWQSLLRSQNEQSARLASLGAKLRLTPSALYRPDTAGTKARNEAKGPKPWETRTGNLA